MSDELDGLKVRLNNVESMLVDIRGWRDPKNTNGRIDQINGEIESLNLRISKQNEVIKQILDSIKGISNEKTVKKPMGRPKKKMVSEKAV
jgi:hypothetical protein